MYDNQCFYDFLLKYLSICKKHMAILQTKFNLHEHFFSKLIHISTEASFAFHSAFVKSKDNMQKERRLPFIL